MALQKIEKFNGLQKAAPERIETNETESALLNAQFVRDAHMQDLHVEFAARQQKIKQAYLTAVAEIMAGAE